MSAIRPDLRDRFTGLPYFAYDPSAGVIARSESAPQTSFPLPHSGAGSTPARSSGVARFTPAGMQQSLTPYRREEDGGGANVLFGHTTNGRPRYGGERYLLDTAKGADLGWAEGGIVFDSRFAHHPSCIHEPRWSRLLAPVNHLTMAVEPGERL